MKANDCPKCAKPMEEGFIINYSHAAAVPSTWIAGRPERSVWIGIDLGLNLKGRQRIAITTYRCIGCGFMESYAN
jgi:Domain of unknown function (DUF6487)